MQARDLDSHTGAMAHSRVFSLPPAVIGIAYLLGYVALDWVSFIDPFATFGITPWNPPPGLSFVLLVLFGQRYLPLLFIAPVLADLLVRQLPFPWSLELLVAALNGGIYALGLRFLLRPSTRFNPTLASMRDLIMLLSVAAGSAVAVAIAHVGLLVAFDMLSIRAFVAAALQFWIGDMIGIAVIAPAALIFLTRGLQLRPTRETGGQILAVFAALALVFLYSEKHQFQLFYVLFLPAIWMAVRGGLGVVTIGIVITQVGLILGVHLLPTSEIDVSAFQALMLVLTLTGLVAGALVNEHRNTEAKLRLHQDSLARLARLGSMGELAAAVAHEINQPLTAAGTYARMVADMLRTPGDDPAIAETARKAAAQIERAADVVRRLRALIRLDQTGRAPVSVEHVITETLVLIRPQLDRHNIVTRLHLADDLPPVMADLLQIEQVLLNLLRNSIEAIEQAGQPTGTITIAGTNTGPHEVEISVQDTGPGFPTEVADTYLPLLSSAKAEGLGIGLALCRSIVESHGGQLFVDDRVVGARVRFRLPAAEVARG
jgi:two-component system, LuxR family, sensor kinase FixL